MEDVVKNLKRYLKNCSDNIDTIIDKDKLDDKYKAKKSILLVSYYKLMSILFKSGKSKSKHGKGLPDNEILEKVLNQFASKKKSLSEIALKASLKQLDCPVNGPLNDGHGGGQQGGKNQKSGNGAGRNRKTLETIHNNNIIDNIMFLVPMYSMCDSKHSKNIIQSINYSNTIESINHKAELMLTMYEKYTKNGTKPDMAKKFKLLMVIYNEARHQMSQYI